MFTSDVGLFQFDDFFFGRRSGLDPFAELVQGLLLNLGGPAQMYDFQRFLAARSPRDAAKLGAAWSAFLVVRWAMCAGIVLLALAGVMNVTDPERVMPMVLAKYLPVGVRGLVVAGLLAALRLLGLSTSTAHQPTATPNRSGPVCFETPGDFEITIDGRKLIGSAQMRGRGTLLQHGTLPLYGDLARICALLSTPTDPRHVRRRATTLVEAAGRKVTWEEAAAAMTAGFQEALHVSLEEGELTAEELSIAARLRQEKYTNAAWTGKL